MTVHIEPLEREYFAVRFPYNERLVRRIKSLPNRRWNKEKSRWEVHISHLGEVLRLLNRKADDVDKKLLRSFQIYRIRNCSVRLLLGNVVAELSGTGLPVDKIDAATSFLLPGHQFMPSFQEGKWDGRRHLWNHKTQSFPAGLAERVQELLRSEGVVYEVVPPPELPEGTLQFEAPKLTLRDYQQECLEAALQARRGVIELATGSGKTAVATCIINHLRHRTLFLVHTRDLLYQTREYMEQQLGVKVGQAGDGVVRIEPVTVATVQTCAKALGIKLAKTEDDEEKLEDDKTDLRGTRELLINTIRNCPVVFFDECHHLPADCCYSLAMETQGAGYRYGLSATPYRSDRMDLLLEAALGAKIYRANASVLIEKGFLVPPHITFENVPATSLQLADQDYQSIFLTCVLTNPVRNQLIANAVREIVSQGMTVLVLVSQVRHGEILQGLLADVPLVQGSDPAEKRRVIFRDLETGRQPAVIATTLADEGLDIPTLGAVVLASGGKSETRALQRIGRALRPAQGKTKALVIDFFDNAPYLTEHSLKRIEVFRSEPLFQVTGKGFALPEPKEKKRKKTGGEEVANEEVQRKERSAEHQGKKKASVTSGRRPKSKLTNR